MTDIPFGPIPGSGNPDPDKARRQFEELLSQVQFLFGSNPSQAPVNWELARRMAESQIEGRDPAVTSAEAEAIGEALRLADLWLEPHSTLPSGIHAVVGWRRRDWLGETLAIWQQLCDPVAARMASSLSELVPKEALEQLGPMSAMLSSISGAMFGGQLGGALAKLAAEVLSATDIGLPLSRPGVAALVQANIVAYGSGLEVPEDEVRLYVALREAAHQRLFGHVSWLRNHVLTAVETYAAGITVDRSAIEDTVSQIDINRPETMQELSLEGLLTPEDSPEQKAALARLETLLALVEGWVSHVVDRAVVDRLPSHNRLSEAFRRRRAAGGPAEQTFAALVGLELRPRRLREANALWAALTEARGIAGRDSIWDHPDLLPRSEDLTDPTGFVQGSGGFDFTDLGDINFGPSTPEAGGPETPEAGGSDTPEAGGPEKPER